MLYTDAVHSSSFADSSDHYLETLHQSLYRFFKSISKSTPGTITWFIANESSSDESAEDKDFYQQLQLFVNDSDSTV